MQDTQKAFFALALGKLQNAPFSDEQMQNLRRRWFKLLPSPSTAEVVPEGQPFYLHAIAQTARLMGEEDADVLDTGPDNYCDGRMVGFGHVFPRVPLVFRAKVKERKYDESEFRAENSNYESAKEHAQQIEVQFQEEERLGFMFPLSEGEAKRRYGERLRVASLGAIPKDDGRVRVIFDATHFVQINNGITILDRLEFPRAGSQCSGDGRDPEFRVPLDDCGGGRYCAGAPPLQTQGGGYWAAWVPGGRLRTYLVQQGGDLRCGLRSLSLLTAGIPPWPSGHEAGGSVPYLSNCCSLMT